MAASLSHIVWHHSNMPEVKRLAEKYNFYINGRMIFYYSAPHHEIKGPFSLISVLAFFFTCWLGLTVIMVLQRPPFGAYGWYTTLLNTLAYSLPLLYFWRWLTMQAFERLALRILKKLDALHPSYYLLSGSSACIALNKALASAARTSLDELYRKKGLTDEMSRVIKDFLVTIETAKEAADWSLKFEEGQAKVAADRIALLLKY